MKGHPLLFVALLAGSAAMAQSDAVPFAIAPDDPVMEQLDRLAMLPWMKNDPFTTDQALLNVHRFAETDTPRYSDDAYRNRIAVLDANTPFSLTYRPVVKSYIELYAVRKREQTERMLGLAQQYFPVFEEALDRHDMPMELKYLAVVESALFPGAKSRAAAVGLWQFMQPTGKMYGLRVDSYTDERCDVYESTDAACRYLKDLYGIFGDWELALAAYNCGPGNVNKAIRRAGGTKDYWAVYEHLPRETRGYVPAFIAVNYIFNHAAEHNLYPLAPNYCAYELDTVQVCYPLDLKMLGTVIGMNEEDLLTLNPVYKRGVIPDPQQAATIYLPKDKVGAYIANEEQLCYAFVPAKQPLIVPVQEQLAQSKKWHTVRRGESLGSIAKKHRVSVSQLRDWNNLRGNTIRPGQRLAVHTSVNAEPTAEAKSVPVKDVAAPTGKSVEYIYHVVQQGDTLWDIARRYPGTTVDDIKRLNRGLNSKSLHPGKRIKVGVQQG
ncbi:MAG: LysM peptidoglycan-binding domain-containing protein [Flavobacteriales bacterium]